MSTGPGDRAPRHVGESVERLAAELGLDAARPAVAVQARWAEVVGEELATHARPVRLREGVLLVEVDAPAWATQVRYLGGRIAEALNGAIAEGTVAEIRVRVRAGEAPP